MDKIKAVVFDMDGTLIDSEEYWIQLFDSIVAKYGKVFTPEDRQAFFGCSHEKEIEILSRYLDLDEEGMLHEKQMYMEEHPFNFKEYLKEGARELIEYLYNKDIRLAIASSNYTKSIQTMLQECELEKYFEFIVSCDMVTHEKPDPEIYLKAIEKLQLPIEEILVIEDSLYGIQAATTAGLTVALIRNPLYSVETTLDLKFNSHYEIMNYINIVVGGK